MRTFPQPTDIDSKYIQSFEMGTFFIFLITTWKTIPNIFPGKKMFVVPASQIYEAMAALKKLSPTEEDNWIGYFLSFLILHITIPHAQEKRQLIASNKLNYHLIFSQNLFGEGMHKAWELTWFARTVKGVRFSPIVS